MLDLKLLPSIKLLLDVIKGHLSLFLTCFPASNYSSLQSMINEETMERKNTLSWLSFLVRIWNEFYCFSFFIISTVHALFLFLRSLEERQRAEKRSRAAKGHQFTPRWFDFTSEITPTPWGDLEVYQYNGKYTEHRASMDNSDSTGEDNGQSTEFNPWQYGNLAAE